MNCSREIRQCIIRAALLMAIPAAMLAAQNREARGASGPAAALSVILGRPTDRSITLSVLSAVEVEAQVEYGVPPGAYTQRTQPRRIEPGTPVEFELGSLKPDTDYGYRLLMRPSGADGATAAPEGRFHTQRRPGGTFTFAVQGDSHPEREGRMFDAGLYALTMRNVGKTRPDFYLMMGDDFSIDRQIQQGTLSQAVVDRIYAHQRSFLGVIGGSVPLFLVNGNHEHAERCLLDGTATNAAVLAGRARTRYFPLPAPGTFYGGDTTEVGSIGLLRDYYAWTWGDALFVVIDFYWHSPVPVDHEPGAERHQKGGRKEGAKKRDLWGVTLGDDQYQWLTRTLTESKSRWKFVFCHHVLGTGRGGIEAAGLYEWGGKDRKGVSRFAEERPGWSLPIHDLMASSGVTIFFQGHDHLYARQELDGVVYQSCPNPADPTYQAFNRDAYRSGDVFPNSGHLRVAVAPDQVRVDYVRSVLTGDETTDLRNGTVAFGYTITANRQRETK